MSAVTNPKTVKPKRWRDLLPVHPAAELFPLMSADELRELAADIEKHDLCEPVDLYRDRETQLYVLLDGRNRLDALALLGRETVETKGHVAHGIYRYVGEDAAFDPYAFVISKNVRRRHLTAEQRRGLIAKVLKARPETSNLQVAKQVKADDKTVAKVRSELEATSEIPKLEKTTGKDGKARPAKRKLAVTCSIGEDGRLSMPDRLEPKQTKSKQAEVTFGAPCDRRKRVFVIQPDKSSDVDIRALRIAWREVELHANANNKTMLKAAIGNLVMQATRALKAMGGLQ